MNELDQFAIAAMQSLLMPTPDGGAWGNYDDLAKASYRVADAMMAEKKRREYPPLYCKRNGLEEKK